MKSSTPRLRIALETSPWLGSTVRKRRKLGCARMTIASPFTKPRSLTMILPPGSRSGFSLSRTCNKQGVIVGSSRRGTKNNRICKTTLSIQVHKRRHLPKRISKNTDWFSIKHLIHKFPEILCTAQVSITKKQSSIALLTYCWVAKVCILKHHPISVFNCLQKSTINPFKLACLPLLLPQGSLEVFHFV